MKNLIKMMMGKIEANISAVIEATIRNIRFLLSPRTFHFTDAVTISNGENDSSSRVRCVSRTHRTRSALFIVCVLVVLGFSSVPGEVKAEEFNAVLDTSQTSIIALTVDTTNNVLYAGTVPGGIIYRCLLSTACDAAGDFTIAYDTPNTYVHSITIDTANGVLYAGTGSGGIIYRCVLSTACDSAGDFTIAYDDPSVSYIQSLAVDSTNGVLYAGTNGIGGIIYRCSMPAGSTTACSSSANFTIATDTPEVAIYSLTIDTANGVLYAGTGSGGIIYRCLLSTACDSVGDFTNSYDPPDGYIYSLAVDSTNGVLFVGSGAGNGILYRCSLPAGSTTACSSPGNFTVAYDTPDSTIESLTIDTANGILYVGIGSNGIIYRCLLSTACDAAGDFTVAYDSIVELYIYSLVVDSQTGNVYAGSGNGGIIHRFCITGCPTVATTTVSSVSGTQATLGGTITSTSSVISRGTCWGTSAIPVTNCIAEGGTATGTFSHVRTGMTAGTAYYARAYATNAYGTIYSSDATFITEGRPSVSAPTVTDVTGNSAKLGGQVVFGGTKALVTAYDTTGSSIFSLAIDTANGVLYAGTDTSGIIYRCLLSTACDSAVDFTIAYDTPESWIYSLAIDTINGVLYAGTGGGGGIIYRCSLPAGSTTACTQASDFITAYDTSESQIHSLTVDTANGVLYAGTANGGIIYRCSMPAGSTTACSSAANFITAYDTSELRISSFAIDTTNGVLYAGSSNGGIIYRCSMPTGSTTACSSAARFTTAYDTPESNIYSLAIDTANGVLYVGSATNGIIYRCLLSTACDSAVDFTIAYDTPAIGIYSLIVDTVNGVLYAGSSAGGIIYRCLLSTACDEAGDFITAYDTLESYIYSLTVDTANGVLYAGTNSGGTIYRLPIAPATISARGTCWGTSAGPTTNCSNALGTSVGTPFSHTRSGMTASTTYYARAYATNAYGTSYSSDVTFVTAGPPAVSISPVTSVTGSTATIGGVVTSSGAGWLIPSYDTSDTEIYSLVVDTANGVLYAGSYIGGIIYRCLLSTGCDTASDFVIAYDTTETYILTFIIDTANGVLYAGSGTGGVIYRCALSTACDEAGDFTGAVSGTQAIWSLAIDSANRVLYAGSGASGIIYRCSMPEGSTTACSSAGNFTTATDTPQSYIYSLTIDTANGVLYAGTNPGGLIYRCALNTACDSVGDFTTATDTPATTIFSLTVDPVNQVLYAGGDGTGIIYRCLLSTGCDSATDFMTAYDSPETTIYSLTVDTVKGILYAGTGSGGIIYRCVLSTQCDAAGDFITAYDTPATSLHELVIDGAGNIFAGSGAEGIIYRVSAESTLTARGTCWGTSASPTTNCSAASTTSTGTFTQPRTGLSAGTTYYARAYATNAYGTSYSSDVVFNTQITPVMSSTTVTSVGTSTATFGGTVNILTTAYDTTNTVIESITVDTVNGVLYAGTNPNGIIYRCLLSTACDTSGDFAVAYDTTQTAIFSLAIDSTNQALYAGSISGGIIYRCLLSTACDASGDFAVAYDTADTEIYTFAFDTANGVLYAGSGFGGGGGMIFRCPLSTACDAAGDFTTAYDPSELYIPTLTIDTTNRVLYAGSADNGIIYRCSLPVGSTTACSSAGNFTIAYDTPQTAIESIAVDTVNGVLYAGTNPNGIIYRCLLSTACDTSGDFAEATDTSETKIPILTLDTTNGILFAGANPSGSIYLCLLSTGCDSNGDFTVATDTSMTSIESLLVANGILFAGADTNGIIYRMPSAVITVRGTCYGTSPSPTTNCVAEGGTGTGVFTQARTGLIPGTTYYARAYATNAYGTGYSADVSTTTGVSSVSLSSAADQSFTIGQVDTAISPITVTANGDALITAANDIRISIATGTLDMRFDTSDVTATLGGGASGKVSGTVSYEGGGSILVLDVTSDFVTSDTITISDLSYKSFNGVRVATTSLALYIDGPADIVSDSVDNKTVAIQGKLALTDHTLFQVGDRFNQKTENNRELFAFRLIVEGETMDVSSLVISLDPVFGIYTNDVTNVALYEDTNSNKSYDGGDVAVGGSGVVSITGGSGTITFSSTFSATGTTNYIMVASTDFLGGDDRFTPSLTTANITATGASSLAAPAMLGGVMFAHHTKGGGASGLTGGYIPPQNVTIQTGGSAGGMVNGVPKTSSNGAGGIDPNMGGTTIGNEFGFLRPNSNGTPYSAWTGGANAYDSDGVYATIATDEGQQSYGNFGFVIPSNNQIKGIQVRLEASANQVFGSISAKLSWDGGSSVTDLKDTGLPGTTDAVYNLGGPDDTWGRSWTPAEMSDGSLTLELIGNTEGNTISLDAVQVKVFFQASGGRRGGGGGVGMIESNQYFANVASAVNNVGNFWANIIDRLLGWWE